MFESLPEVHPRIGMLRHNLHDSAHYRWAYSAWVEPSDHIDTSSLAHMSSKRKVWERGVSLLWRLNSSTYVILRQGVRSMTNQLSRANGRRPILDCKFFVRWSLILSLSTPSRPLRKHQMLLRQRIVLWPSCPDGDYYFSIGVTRRWLHLHKESDGGKRETESSH